MTSGQALETMNKLKESNGYVRFTLDKLPGIKADLVKPDDNWQEWDFAKVVDSLRRWTDRNLKNIKWKVFFKQKSKNKPPVHVFTVRNKVIKLVSASQ